MHLNGVCLCSVSNGMLPLESEHNFMSSSRVKNITLLLVVSSKSD
jgi:hypothetical protein